MPRPVRKTRDWLRRIERESASRKGGRWTRATEWALILSFPLGIVLAFALDEVGEVEEREVVAVLRVGRDRRQGPIRVRTIPAEDRGSTVWRDAIPLAEVTIERVTLRFGWPFPGRTEHPPPVAIALPVQAPDRRIDLTDADAIDDLRSTTGSDLDGAMDAVLSTLEQGARHQDLVAEMRASQTRHQRHWPSTIALVGILWLLIFLVATVTIRSMQATVWITRRLRRRQIIRRLRNGLCPDCRYDLRAERFPKRCPECGRRIWG
jgi:hypothetical protein